MMNNGVYWACLVGGWWFFNLLQQRTCYNGQSSVRARTRRGCGMLSVFAVLSEDLDTVRRSTDGMLSNNSALSFSPYVRHVSACVCCSLAIGLYRCGLLCKASAHWSSTRAPLHSPERHNTSSLGASALMKVQCGPQHPFPFLRVPQGSARHHLRDTDHCKTLLEYHPRNDMTPSLLRVSAPCGGGHVSTFVSVLDETWPPLALTRRLD